MATELSRMSQEQLLLHAEAVERRVAELEAALREIADEDIRVHIYGCRCKGVNEAIMSRYLASKALQQGGEQ